MLSSEAKLVDNIGRLCHDRGMLVSIFSGSMLVRTEADLPSNLNCHHPQQATMIHDLEQQQRRVL